MCSRFTPSEFVPLPASPVHHIIWNIVLTDKLVELTPELISQNNIKHILAILPSREEFQQLNNLIENVSYDVIEYGNEHNMNTSLDTYNFYCEKIDSIAKSEDIRNVLLFCNNGYQRSLPFLAYYITKYHNDEFPTIDKALETILFQVDKNNFQSNIKPITENIKTILQAAG